MLNSEGAGVDDSDHHDVRDGGRNGDPEPDGITGNPLRRLLLVKSDAGRGVEERVICAVVIVWRRVHEDARHHGDLITGDEELRNESGSFKQRRENVTLTGSDFHARLSADIMIILSELKTPHPNP